MNKFIFILILISFSTLAYSDWYSTPFSEDSENQYWVGMSNPQTTEKEALAEAYNEAIKEAIKYNFGFNQKLVESFYQTLNKTESQQESSISTTTILVKKVKPINQLVKENNEKFIAYKKIAYPKNEINQEIARLKDIKTETVINDTMVAEDQNQTLSQIKINTSPSFAKVTLVNKETKKTYFSTTNAKMIVPTGSYKLELSKLGFKTVSYDYIVGLSNKDSNFPLEQSLSQLYIDVLPKDSSIKINNKEYANNTNNEFKAGTYQVEITHPNYLKTTFEYIISSSEDNNLKHSLTPKNSLIHITTEPEDAKVYLNGNYIGQSPIHGTDIQSEQIEISIVKKGYDLKSNVVSINPNKNNIFNFQLSKKR